MKNFFGKYKIFFTSLINVALILCSFSLAFLARFDFNVPPLYLGKAISLLPAVFLIKIAVFWWFRLFRGWWRYVSMADLILISKANVFASLGFLCYAVFVHGLINVPRSIFVLDGIFCFLLMGGIRFLTRAFRENYYPLPFSRQGEKSQILVVGAGCAGQMIAREFRMNPGLKKEIIGFIDDDVKKQNENFQGVPVLGGRDDLPRICQEQKVDEIIIAIPSASGKAIRQIVDRCLESAVKFRTLPGVGDLIDGKVSVQSIRNVDLEDLLGREPVRLDAAQISAYVRGKRILVSGAGGSIGSEICRQVARFGPEKIILFDHAETPLFHIEQELSLNFPDIRLAAIVGDVRYRTRVEILFDEFLPEVVFHAAAYKHVPMMEHNPAEAADNNVRGTKILADAAHQAGVRHFVMISTDKAVNPANVMGASKRAAELYVQTLARRSATNFVTVRFGNVLGSNGSVVPIFKEQIRKGGPVTVTHPEVTRFFMTIPEAVQLVLQAGSMGKGGEIFLLDMGEPVKIVHLAEELIRLSGLRPYEDIEIAFSGLRPGEKLFEELLLAGEGTAPTSHEKILVAKATRCDEAKLNRQLEALFAAARDLDLEATVALFREIVPEFRQAVPEAKVVLHPAVRSASAVKEEGAAHVG